MGVDIVYWDGKFFEFIELDIVRFLFEIIRKYYILYKIESMEKNIVFL